MSTTVPRSVSHISTLTRTGGGYWMLMHPLEEAGESTGLYRVVFGGPEQETLPRQAPVTANEVIRALTAVHGAETKLKTLRWGSRFSDATRQVSAYRCGRILFGGDAAHVHSPIGGQGVNLGIQDAMNLGWKLAAHIQDRAPDGLLDSYHTERHPVGARVLAMTRAQTVLMSPPPEADDVRALREIIITLARLPDANRYLAGLMSGLDLRYDFGDSDPLVGARMVDLSLETRRRLDHGQHTAAVRARCAPATRWTSVIPDADTRWRRPRHRSCGRLARRRRTGCITRCRPRPDPTRRARLLGRCRTGLVTCVGAAPLVRPPGRSGPLSGIRRG